MASFPTMHVLQGCREEGTVCAGRCDQITGRDGDRGRFRTGPLVAANRTAISALFSHHFPLARPAEAFGFAMSRPPDAVKIVVTVN